VKRYEQLAENTLDAQQRTAADVAELRSRAASIEQILRTAESRPGSGGCRRSSQISCTSRSAGTPL
jgi:hypothetical protein